MVAKLFFQALIKYVFGVVIVGALIFLPAGTFSFFNGWLFMAILFLPILIAGVVMFFKNPELLKRRLDSNEKQKDQSIVVKLSGLMFLVGFILCGLGSRFGWYTLPKTVSVIAAAVLWRTDRRIGWPAVILAALIGLSRLYLFVHFPTDVLGAAVLGIPLALAAQFAVEQSAALWQKRGGFKKK